jgi:two-component system response regulator YesN
MVNQQAIANPSPAKIPLVLKDLFDYKIDGGITSIISGRGFCMAVSNALFKVIVGCNDSETKEKLLHEISFAGLGLKLIAVCHDGSELIRNIEKEKPEIVIVDLDLGNGKIQKNALELIKEGAKKSTGSNFILIGGSRDFNFLYDAIKGGVEDYCLKPLNSIEMRESLERIADKLNRQTAWSGLSNEMLRKFFISKLYEWDDSSLQNLDNINREYRTFFKPGYYRMFFIKLDTIQDNVVFYAYSNELFQEIEIVAQNHFQNFVTEIVFRYLKDGVVVLLNYSKESQNEIINVFPHLFNSLKDLVQKKNNIHITILVSTQRDDISNIPILYREIYNASWTRYFHGKEKVLYYEKPEKDIEYIYQQKFISILSEINKAVEILDGHEFAHCMEDFFTLPDNILSRIESFIFLHEVRDHVFKVSKAYIQPKMQFENMNEEILHVLHMADTLETYKSIFIDRLSNLLQSCADYSKNQLSKAIRYTIAYIQGNYGSLFSLQEIAEKLGLSVTYFSARFKKETGQNFINYLTDYRLMVAKRMLRNSDMNISEIADFVSYSDVRYFGRIFKKHVGMKPTEYRKAFG